MFRTRRSSNELWRAARAFVALLTTTFFTSLPQPARADQGGIGFWLPGTFGSLAATPLQPGLSMSALYLHSSVSADGDVAASRTIRFPNLKGYKEFAAEHRPEGWKLWLTFAISQAERK